MISALDRRQFLRGAALAGSGAALSAWLPAWAQTISPGMRPTLPTVSGEDITLTIARQSMTIDGRKRSEEHTSELQSLMRISYAVFCSKKKKLEKTKKPYKDPKYYTAQSHRMNIT